MNLSFHTGAVPDETRCRMKRSAGSGFPLAGGNCNGLRGGSARLPPTASRAGIRASTDEAGCLTGVAGADSVSVHRREGTGSRQGHDATCRLTRLGGPPNACRLAHRSKARHRDRQTALTEQPCNGEQASAKNDVKWRQSNRDHAGR